MSNLELLIRVYGDSSSDDLIAGDGVIISTIKEELCGAIDRIGGVSLSVVDEDGNVNYVDLDDVLSITKI